jgi:hypothetical protein
MQVVQDDRSRLVVETHTDPRLQDAALFTRSDGQIHIVDVRQRPAAQDGIAVPTHGKTVLRMVRAMRHLQGVAQELSLVVKARPWHVFGHFLKQNDIRFVLANAGDDALDSVSPVDAADAFVDVPG